MVYTACDFIIQGVPDVSIIDWIAKWTGKESSEVASEWHSFELGWSEMICLRIPSFYSPTEFSKGEMENEYHYFSLGRAVGVISWVIILAVLL